MAKNAAQIAIRLAHVSPFLWVRRNRTPVGLAGAVSLSPAPSPRFVQKPSAPSTTEVADLIAKVHRVDHPHLLGSVLPRFDLGVDGIGDLLERRAREAPDKPFLVFYDDDARTREDFTRQEFLVEVRKAVKVLDDLGLKEGDAIATADEFNHSDTLVVLFAAWASGIMAVPLNLKEDEERLHYIQHHAGVKATFVRDNCAARVAPIARKAGADMVISFGEECVRTLYDAEWGEMMYSVQDEADLPPRKLGTDALNVYTSGTTGNPKGVILTHEMLYDAHGITVHHGFGPHDVCAV